MAVKQRGSAAKADATGAVSSIPAEVNAAVGDIVAASKATATQVPKATRRRIEKLGRQLDAARATEAKRLRQAARLREELAKRERQAADAAALMASIVAAIRDAASGVVGARPVRTPARTRATANKAPATKAAAKPASASKPAAAKAPAKAAAAKRAGAARPASAAKAPTRRRSATTPRPRPATRLRAASTRTTKPKPTA
jgi:hypothetical protein